MKSPAHLFYRLFAATGPYSENIQGNPFSSLEEAMEYNSQSSFSELKGVIEVGGPEPVFHKAVKKYAPGWYRCETVMGAHTSSSIVWCDGKEFYNSKLEDGKGLFRRDPMADKATKIYPFNGE